MPMYMVRVPHQNGGFIAQEVVAELDLPQVVRRLSRRYLGMRLTVEAVRPAPDDPFRDSAPTCPDVAGRDL